MEFGVGVDRVSTFLLDTSMNLRVVGFFIVMY